MASDGHRPLLEVVDEHEGYQVFFYDGDGPAHVATPCGMWQPENFEPFCRDNNVIIIHDDEYYKERLVFELSNTMLRFPFHIVARFLDRRGFEGDLTLVSNIKETIHTFLMEKFSIPQLKEVIGDFNEVSSRAYLVEPSNDGGYPHCNR